MFLQSGGCRPFSFSRAIRPRAVSEETVREMVAGALKALDVDVALAVSGIAGPDGGVLHHAELQGDRAVTIGRAPDCSIRVEDPKVSRHHVELKPLSGERGWVLRDMGSTHGCIVQGQRVRELVIRPGLEVKIGAAVLRFASAADRISAELNASLPDEY
jgi:predicted component of type VI protein secretion system